MKSRRGWETKQFIELCNSYNIPIVAALLLKFEQLKPAMYNQ